MNREMPTIGAMAYASNTIDANHWDVQPRCMGGQALNQLMQNVTAPTQSKQETLVSAARIIKVYIADPNDNLPLEKRVLYKGDEKLTDLTDQELFFEVPIAELLAKHNEERVKTTDKAQSAKFGRDIFLEPAKIRDLKMVVTTVATF